MTTLLSGIDKLDHITGGFLPGKLILFCDWQGMEKLNLLERIMLNTVHKAVRDKNPEFVLFFKLVNTKIVGIPRFIRGIPRLQSPVVIVESAWTIPHQGCC